MYVYKCVYIYTYKHIHTYYMVCVYANIVRIIIVQKKYWIDCARRLPVPTVKTWPRVAWLLHACCQSGS